MLSLDNTRDQCLSFAISIKESYELLEEMESQKPIRFEMSMYQKMDDIFKDLYNK